MADPNRDRYAAIDVGTNSVLLTIAEGPELSVLTQLSTVTRLGQGVDRTGKLAPDAIERTLDCLRDYRAELDEYRPTSARAVGTSALRDAAGGSEFTSRAARILGFEVEVISGAMEAELTFSGALHELSVSGNAFVFDIGGGSTEVILGNADTGEISFATSLDIGSVRLTERLALSDPPRADEIAALRTEIADALEALPKDLPQPLTVVGVAGTVTTLSAISQRLNEYDSSKVHGHCLAVESLRELADRLSGMTVEERLTLPGLTKGRADVIGAGSALCAALLEFTAQPRLMGSDRGVRFGLLRQLAARTD